MSPKYIAFHLLFLSISVLIGCKNNEQTSKEPDVENSWSVNFTLQDAAVSVPLSEEDASTLKNLLSSDAWINNLSNCESDVLLKSSDNDCYYYHSECGTFNDRNNKRSLTLDDENKATFNDLLRKYGRLYID